MTKEQFYEKYDIDPDEMGWLGSGQFGDAYAVEDNRVLKITHSAKEYEIAKKLIGHKYTNIVDYYAAEKVGSDYYILMEELDQPGSIEDLFSEAESVLPDGILYADMFDRRDYEDDEYREENGLPYVSEETMDFIDELCDVVSDYRKLGIAVGDIHAGNLGRSQDGTLKAFDIFDRSA